MAARFHIRNRPGGPPGRLLPPRHDGQHTSAIVAGTMSAVVSSPLRKNILLSENRKVCSNPLHPALTGGRVAIVTNVGRGMRWTRALSIWRTTAPADGKVAWSWYPDADIKLAGSSAGDGGKKARLTRESAKETVKTIRAGKADCKRRTCGDW